MQAILFSHRAQCFTYPSPFLILFPSSIFSFSLLHNFIIFPPQCFYSLLHNFYYFPSSMFFIPLLHLHLLIYSIYFSIHKYIDPTSTPHRPHIDPTSTPHRPYIDPTSTPQWHSRLLSMLVFCCNSFNACRSLRGRLCFGFVIRELKNHNEFHDDDVCWLGKDWNENVSFDGKKET